MEHSEGKHRAAHRSSPKRARRRFDGWAEDFQAAIVTQACAEAMESEFNSVLGKLGRKFRGVPIYHGHPDVDPEIWQDDRRIGKITKLEARADGLWGHAEWNSIGKENKAESWWVFPSPRWDAPPGQPQFSPDRLISVGLTNTPRIAESDPVFNSQQPTKNNTIMDSKLIREKLGLPPECTDSKSSAVFTLSRPRT